jgi:hypothetical protein
MAMRSRLRAAFPVAILSVIAAASAPRALEPGQAGIFEPRPKLPTTADSLAEGDKFIRAVPLRG